jgi:uncharacterized membrane protein YhiD involved in acid resistance
MQEFLNLYSKIENPTFEMVLFTFLLAFVLAVMIALTYYYTTPTTLKTSNFVQAMILSALIASMVIQSTGNSVASGLGMLGALTIIQFRSSFRDPRDIIFMFAALGSGIACGSYVFFIAVAGAVGFCLAAFMLRFTPFHLGNHLIWELRIRVDNPEKMLIAEQILVIFCEKIIAEGIKSENGKSDLMYKELDYLITFKDDLQYKNFVETLEKQSVSVRKLSKQSNEFRNGD